MPKLAAIATIEVPPGCRTEFLPSRALLWS
jgi:hypothetical protein